MWWQPGFKYLFDLGKEKNLSYSGKVVLHKPFLLFMMLQTKAIFSPGPAIVNCHYTTGNVKNDAY